MAAHLESQVDFDKFKTFKTEVIKDSLEPKWDKTFGVGGLAPPISICLPLPGDSL